MVAVESQSSWIYTGGFCSKGGAMLQHHDNVGNGDLIDDNFSLQNIELGFVSFTGMFN
jgi:hypothetical protein